MKITFASLDQAKTLMGTSDSYSKSLNPFNLYWTNEASTEEEFLKNSSDSCVPWTQTDIKRGTVLINRFLSALKKNKIDINQEIFLVKTNGKDCNNLPYTRENFIVFPSVVSKEEETKDESKQLETFGLGLLVHETFHIISRLNPEIKNTLYPFIGFMNSCNFNQEKYLPEQLVINPDALNHNYAIPVMHENRPYLGTPVFEGFHKGVKLLLFNKDGEYQRIVRHKKTNYMKTVEKVAASGYVIHPEEILAELFRVSLTQKQTSEKCSLFLNILALTFPEKVSEGTPA